MAGKDDRIIKREKDEEFQQIYQLAHHSFTHPTDPKEVLFSISFFYTFGSQALEFWGRNMYIRNL